MSNRAFLFGSQNVVAPVKKGVVLPPTLRELANDPAIRVKGDLWLIGEQRHALPHENVSPRRWGK